MDDHTPTPWRHQLAKYAVDGDYDCAIAAMIEGKTYCIGEMVGRCAIEVRLPAESNAAFIVKACNAHDALTDLATNIGSFDDGLMKSTDLNVIRQALREWRDHARAILASIKEAS